MQPLEATVLVRAMAVIATIQDTSSNETAKCETGCSVPVLAYEEVGCEPVFANPGDCCPSHYDCSKFEDRDPDRCYYKEKVFKRGDKIGNSTGNCLANCFCNKNNDRDIKCSTIDCDEFWDEKDMGPGCYRSYKLDQCCSTGIVCPPFDKLAKCKVGKQTFYEGRKWFSKDNTLECVCKPGFQGKLEAPFCMKINCGTELLYADDFKNKCAPVYYGSNGVCPIQWECYSDYDPVYPNAKGTKSVQKCIYGEKKLNIGDKLIVQSDSIHSRDIHCKCKIPPLVTCVL